MFCQNTSFLFKSLNSNKTKVTNLSLKKYLLFPLHYSSYLVDYPFCIIINRRKRIKVFLMFSIKTIFTQIPRYVNQTDEYYLRRSEEKRRTLNEMLYLNFIRDAIDQKHLQESSDYETTGNYTLLSSPKLFVEKKCTKYELQSRNRFHFIPLPPEKLMKVLIKPKYIALGKVCIGSNLLGFEVFGLVYYSGVPF